MEKIQKMIEELKSEKNRTIQSVWSELTTGSKRLGAQIAKEKDVRQFLQLKAQLDELTADCQARVDQLETELGKTLEFFERKRNEFFQQKIDLHLEANRRLNEYVRNKGVIVELTKLQHDIEQSIKALEADPLSSNLPSMEIIIDRLACLDSFDQEKKRLTTDMKKTLHDLENETLIEMQHFITSGQSTATPIVNQTFLTTTAPSLPQLEMLPAPPILHQSDLPRSVADILADPNSDSSMVTTLQAAAQQIEKIIQPGNFDIMGLSADELVILDKQLTEYVAADPDDRLEILMPYIDDMEPHSHDCLLSTQQSTIHYTKKLDQDPKRQHEMSRKREEELVISIIKFRQNSLQKDDVDFQITAPFRLRRLDVMVQNDTVVEGSKCPLISAQFFVEHFLVYEIRPKRIKLINDNCQENITEVLTFYRELKDRLNPSQTTLLDVDSLVQLLISLRNNYNRKGGLTLKQVNFAYELIFDLAARLTAFNLVADLLEIPTSDSPKLITEVTHGNH